eukprot:CAMPEP_0177571646 /NCGR_PEP_ID=MMETSP0369-20130122/77554_1 /TAXON_ID=447022 ORGANISM="Scrippsiella hangoei-like, Strain SHHI-4" /NCGR_SAMPLE_ID=MMETSP0369 /ASSEMBLY_ACC=CAM_ASM_000364 /LENGTH=229 /DNA_ID=CAMNT_0019059603 /DNA_START=50 /DNA_END=737 /DNA_ORIENTATION=+
MADDATDIAEQLAAVKLAPADLGRGFWASGAGQIHIFDDKMTAQLSYEELLGDGDERLHGRLLPGSGPDTWRAELSILSVDEEPWYGPSFGEKPESVGEITATLRVDSDGTRHLETRIKAEGDKDWGSLVLFKPCEEEVEKKEPDAAATVTEQQQRNEHEWAEEEVGCDLPVYGSDWMWTSGYELEHANHSQVCLVSDSWVLPCWTSVARFPSVRCGMGRFASALGKKK